MAEFLNLLRTYQAYGLIAFVVTIFATPIAIQVARRLGVMDMPDQDLKPHARPTPYLGGAAICLGWSVALVVAMSFRAADWHVMLPIMIGGILVSVVGLVDDIRGVSPQRRLWVCAGIILVVLLTAKTGFRLTGSVLSPAGIDLPEPVASVLSVLIGVILVLGACNSTNLIDGMDGLCTGVTAIISLGFFLLAAHLAVWEYSRAGDPVRLALAIAMFGAAMGFLPLNFNPARIFMGDAGSTLLGYSCGMMILLFAERGIFRWVLGGLMVFALPMFDTALAVARRWHHKRPIFLGDRSHFYDQLLDRGLSVRKVVGISYGLAALYVAIGCGAIWLRTRYTIPVYLLVLALTAAAAFAARMVR